MIRLINRENIGACGTLVRAMHADRKRVFVDTLKWDIPHDDVIESDEFDDDSAEYLVVQDAQGGMESVVHGLSGALQQNGHTVQVATLRMIFSSRAMAPSGSLPSGRPSCSHR